MAPADIQRRQEELSEALRGPLSVDFRIVQLTNLLAKEIMKTIYAYDDADLIRSLQLMTKAQVRMQKKRGTFESIGDRIAAVQQNQNYE